MIGRRSICSFGEIYDRLRDVYARLARYMIGRRSLFSLGVVYEISEGALPLASANAEANLMG